MKREECNGNLFESGKAEFSDRGQTMAADMICAYYDLTADSRRMFEKCRLSGCPAESTEIGSIAWDYYLNHF